MATGFAHAVLLAWPLVAAALFWLRPRAEALVWTVLGGYLVLPVAVGVDLPVLPAFDKTLIPSLAALALCSLYLRDEGPAASSWVPSSLPGRLLLAAFLVSPVLTVLVNGDPVLGGGRPIRGLSLYDAGSFALTNMVLVLPLLLGRRFLGTPDSHRMILGCLALAGLAYSLAVVVEVRLSPQLHRWVYGFFPHQFLQQIRFGGFRPVVFLGHGLLVALFMAGALVSALALWRLSLGQMRWAWGGAVLWLGLAVVLCKSVGALALAVLGVVLVALGGRWMVRLAVVGVAVVVLSYPLLRASGGLPTEAVVYTVAEFAPDRAQSLQFRLDNETILLERAKDRPVLGWGGWGRNRVYDAYGSDVSVTDGRWIITLGTYGWLGFLGEFGLLALGLLMLSAQGGRHMPFATGALAVVLALCLADLVPNASLNPVTWLLAGAMLGYAERRSAVPSVAPRAAVPA